MTNLCFQRELRLVTPDHYKRVFDNPVKASSPNITILAKPNDLEHMRLGLIVPKKVLKHAVDRNRIKRLTRNFFRLNQHRLPCLDYVFIAKGKIGDMTNNEVVNLLEKLCTVISRRSKKSV
jgi:ribonuclease P protein component